MPSNAKQSRVVTAEIVTNLLRPRTPVGDVTDAVDRFRSLLATPDLDVNAAVYDRSSPNALLAVCVDLIFPIEHPESLNGIFDVAGPKQLQLLDCLGLLIAHKATDVNASLTRVYRKRRSVVSAAYAVFTAAHHVFRVQIVRQFLKRADFDVIHANPMYRENLSLFEAVFRFWSSELHDMEVRLAIIAHAKFDVRSVDLFSWHINSVMRTDDLLALLAHPTFAPNLPLADAIEVLVLHHDCMGLRIRGDDGTVRILRALLDHERSAVQTLRPFVALRPELQWRANRVLFKCERFDIQNIGR